MNAESYTPPFAMRTVAPRANLSVQPVMGPAHQDDRDHGSRLQRRRFREEKDDGSSGRRRTTPMPATGRRPPEVRKIGGGGGRCATKPPTPRLAAVEAAEQAKKLRVVGEEVAGVREGGCLRRGESRNGLSAMALAARPVAEA
jgi:hypothetical protein